MERKRKKRKDREDKLQTRLTGLIFHRPQNLSSTEIQYSNLTICSYLRSIRIYLWSRERQRERERKRGREAERERGIKRERKTER